MKKCFMLFMAFLVCLAIFNSVFGYNNRRYKESVQSVVNVVNKVGRASSSTLSLFTSVFSKNDKVLSVEIPENLMYAWQIMYVNHHLECDEKCLSDLNYYLHNMFYSDVKRYYLGTGKGDYNDKFESSVFRWYFPEFRNSQPELVEHIYYYALEAGYPMDNPYWPDCVPRYEYTCECCK